MPELPEVERGRRVLEDALVGESIANVDVVDDEIVFDGVRAAKVRKALEGAHVEAAGRWGKHLWLELDRKPWPLFHFGMTGAFEVRGCESLALKTGPTPDDAWPPRFAKLTMTTASGRQVAFTNARRFGRIRLRDDPRAEPPLNDLGFDPLLEPPTGELLTPKLARRRGTIKGVLLDQKFVAGVGNWIADEVLYMARLAPHRVANGLKRGEINRLADALEKVIGIAVAVDAESSLFPRGWLFHLRWRPAANPTTARGEPVVVEKIAGRTTVWVPSRQR